jgi:hypothetical protein
MIDDNVIYPRLIVLVFMKKKINFQNHDIKDFIISTNFWCH